MPVLKQAAAFVYVATAAWISQATLALTDAGDSLDRVTLLPLSPQAVVIVILAGVLGVAALRFGVPQGAFAPLLLCGLPWLPIPVPPSLLVWTGPAVLLSWTAAVAAVSTSFRAPGWRVTRPAAAAGIVAGILFSAAAWAVSPSLPGGDEPHYLIITQSLLNDGDLLIEDNHRRGEYRQYFAGELRPDFLRRGRNGQIYSIHAPGIPALVAPAFLIGGYPGVVVFLVLLSAAGSALAWHVAWLRTGRTDAAWFGWAAVTIGVTAVFHAFSVYPDAPGGIVVLSGVWALVRLEAARRTSNTGADHRVLPWFLHGAALAVLPWLHTRFAVLAGTLGLLIVARLWSTPNRIQKLLAFISVPVLSCAGWIAYFVAIYGVADPSAPYGGDIGSAAFIVDGLVGLFVDQRFGLLTYTPVLVFALAGFAVMRGRLALELLFVIVPYLLLVTNFRMWWAGWSAPARFMVPILPLLVVPAAEAWCAIRRRGTRAVALGAIVLTALLTAIVVGVDHGRLAYNSRTELSLLLRWFTRNADLDRALPAWSVREAELFRDAAIWCAAMLGAWLAVRSVDRAARLRGRAALTAATAGIFAAAGMAAATVVWRAAGVDGTSPVPGQLALLRAAASTPRALFLGIQPPRRLARDDLPREVRLRPPLLPVPEGPGGDRVPMLVLPAVPAGEYRLRPGVRGTGGMVTIGVGRNVYPLETVAAVSADAIDLKLPVSVSAIVIRGDDEARRNVRSLLIEPQSLVRPGERLTSGFAGRVAHYANATVFFLDDDSFPEAEAFWVGGARGSSIVLQLEPPHGSVAMLLRNAPVENRLEIQSGGWREELTLQPGEERRIQVPIEPRGASVIRFAVTSGFRPSEVDAASKDERFLGVWIKLI